MMQRRFAVALIVSIGALAACGTDRSSRPAPQSPPSAHYGIDKQSAADAEMAPPARPSEPAPATAPAGAAPSPPVAAPAAVEPSSERGEAPSAADPHGRYARANVQLAEARRQLDVAAGQRDCASACRALDSMERAAGQVCELARSNDERRTCRAAEEQVGSARARVKSACGECPRK
jgi:hypothetical protein